MPWFLCDIIGRDIVRDKGGYLETEGFLTSISIEASTDKEAESKARFLYKRKAQQWEHPKQVDQGFRAKIEARVRRNENKSPSLKLGSKVKWVKMSEINK